MPLLTFTSLVFAGSFAAGLLGALTGLGGGVVLIPLLTLGFHVDMRYAIGASLVSVIATSSGAAAAYVREGYSNVRIGMFLEMATTFGAVAGAFLAARTPTRALAMVFGVVLLYSAWLSRSQQAHEASSVPNPWSERLRMSGQYPDGRGGKISYVVDRIAAGFATMFGAGVLSGLLGIGSGAVKVLAMDHVMRIPFKVSTTTSNFMIGVTAAASAGIYLARGYVDPVLAAPVLLGVLAGSLLGAKALTRARVPLLRTIFAWVIAALGVEMIVNGWMGRL
ncbi:MAG TPA: sulfite exporter TauE/SafE family protein [Acidobacteriaceae bacterium]|nr:sulfite exporter TauE/SafE family protein [Acidobacteriaceae bacterium]